MSELQQPIVDATVVVGGLLRADAFSNMLRCHYDQPISQLARWIVDRRVLSVVWCSYMMVPLFQFQAPRLEPLPALLGVRKELDAIFGEWELLEWFVRPNSALDGAMPARCILRDPAAVLEAARTDRFVVAGL